MSDWTNSHDLVYAFVCVSFLADGEVDESGENWTINSSGFNLTLGYRF